MKKIAVSSGKGGTGKTTISVLFSLILSEKYKINLIDCDVENPNCHIFFKSRTPKIQKAEVFRPGFDLDKCSFCRKCQQICQFNCIAVTGEDILFFDQLCHSCKGCIRICPENAVFEQEKIIGDIFSSQPSRNIYLDYAVLNIGEARGIPLIDDLKKNTHDADFVIYDSPPGAACPMVAAVKNTDYAVLVTEPTAFGLFDLKIAWKIIDKLNIPAGVVINRSVGDDSMIEDFADQVNIPVLFKIPYSKDFARQYSKGNIDPNSFPEIKKKIFNLCGKI
ncbi:MAG: P-loop NTPase [Elusimicrobiota bacterium]